MARARLFHGERAKSGTKRSSKPRLKDEPTGIVSPAAGRTSEVSESPSKLGLAVATVAPPLWPLTATAPTTNSAGAAGRAGATLLPKGDVRSSVTRRSKSSTSPRLATSRV